MWKCCQLSMLPMTNAAAVLVAAVWGAAILAAPVGRSPHDRRPPATAHPPLCNEWQSYRFAIGSRNSRPNRNYESSQRWCTFRRKPMPTGASPSAVATRSLTTVAFAPVSQSAEHETAFPVEPVSGNADVTTTSVLISRTTEP